MVVTTLLNLLCVAGLIAQFETFFVDYRPLANTWLLFDNSGATPVPIAIQEHAALRIINAELYNLLTARYGVP